MAEEIIKKISDKLSIGLPETLVEQEYMAVMRRRLSNRTQQDIKKEDLEQLKNEGKKKARENLKNHLILKKIAEKESLKVSDQEIQQEFKEIAKANNVPLAQVIDMVNKEGKREELRGSILFKKTVDFLVEQAIIE
jgi:trigger factor